MGSSRKIFAPVLMAAFAATITLSACGQQSAQNAPPGGTVSSNRLGPPNINEDGDKRRRFGSILGDEGLTIGGKKKGDAEQGAGIGVNSFLWRASLDTLAFMPITSADPFGGVILTDWYSDPASPNERVKINLYILDRQLRADGVRVSVFRQTRDGSGQWRDAAAETNTANRLEETILTRARQLRIAQQAAS